MRPTPKSLILDLLSSLRGRATPVRALVAAADLFDISAESIRVALVRLREKGTVAHDDRGQYRLAPAAEPVQRHVAAWTRTEDRVTAWRGVWIGAHIGGLERSEGVINIVADELTLLQVPASAASRDFR